MVYPCQPLNPNNQQFQVLRMSRCTYGDQICSCLLECIVRDIIAPACSTALGREILESGRYVDDISGGNDVQAVLDEAMKDISDTLERFGFSFEMLLTNYIKFKLMGILSVDRLKVDKIQNLCFTIVGTFVQMRLKTFRTLMFIERCGAAMPALACWKLMLTNLQ